MVKLYHDKVSGQRLLLKNASSVVVRLPVIGIEMEGYGEVVQSSLVLLQKIVTLPAEEPCLSLMAGIVLDELSEVHYCVVPVS